MAELEITPVNIPEDATIPVVKKRHAKPFSTQQIDNALIQSRGDRTEACAALGMKVETMRQRIYQNKYLKLRWTRSAMWERVKSEADKAEKEGRPPDPVTTMERQLDELCMTIAMNSPTTQARLRALGERIINGEQAMTSTDPEFVKLWRFKTNVKGEPTEEAMVREEYRQMIEQLRKDAEAVAGINLKRAQMAMLMRKQTGGKARAGIARPGFIPKGQSPVKSPVMITDSQVIIQNGTKSNGQQAG